MSKYKLLDAVIVRAEISPFKPKVDTSDDPNFTNMSGGCSEFVRVTMAKTQMGLFVQHPWLIEVDEWAELRHLLQTHTDAKIIEGKVESISRDDSDLIMTAKRVKEKMKELNGAK